MRLEKDLIGELEIDEEVYYGIQTVRACQNFSISGRTVELYPHLIRSMAFIKKAAAMSNHSVGVLEQEKKNVICQAADEIIDGKMTNQFPVDIYQGGGGVSINMNVNEVIANRANELLTGQKGYDCIHPNEHVNMSQSTNDVLPSAMKMACFFYIEDLLISLNKIEFSLADKVDGFSSIVKIARTCLQDAVPITLGQQFSGYHSFIKRQVEDIKNLQKECLSIIVGATAVGTGIGAAPGYTEKMYEYLPEVSNVSVYKEENFFDGMQNADIYLKISAHLKGLSSGLSKLSSDLRLLSSGPRAGFAEINLPAVQPGSSIMPGKINPCIPEMMMQVCFDVYGNDQAITFAVDRGELDLNIWEPIILKNLFESFSILTNGIRLFTEKCLDGIEVNKKICFNHAEKSLSLSVVISSLFGYQVANEVALEAHEKNSTIKEVVVEKGLLKEEEASKLLNPENLTDSVKMHHLLNLKTHYNG
ncbi:aspartate ammonia-lyase [Peribacillus loiseleuriae]|uniref:Aspartate ammonia-lyase n=1 Tax=Peribacillus loiseleuriae TaxID=1679170 RepID=A0A0K9GQN0_9BACI|nr:aspartate ammonia-lyase [Peribacillus loiseleuriae]KMY48911.1 aspartate ammonia-lyase [Peribacillus loiseleuriae]